MEILQEPRENAADRLVDGCRAQAASHDEDHRFAGRKSRELQGPDGIALQELLSDGGAGQHCLVCRQILQGLGEIAADLPGGRDADLIGQSRSQIGLVDNRRNMKMPGGQHHRDRHKAALGEEHVRLQLFDNAPGLAIALEHLEGIREILRIKVAAQLSGGNAVVGDLKFLDQLFFYSVVGAHVGNLVAELPESRQQGNIGSNVSGGASAGQKYSLQ